MPDVALDFSWTHPDVAELVANEIKAILVYSRISTPDRAYLDAAVAAGVGVCPIFETAATRPWDGYSAGVADGDGAQGDLERIGVPDGVRLYVNMSDTPDVGGHEAAIAEYARGFAESFPGRWELGAYGPLDGLRAAQAGSARFDALWAVETWGAPRGTPEEHFAFWQGEADVVLVQMANIPPPFAGTDTNWIIAPIGAWGQTGAAHDMTPDEVDAYIFGPTEFGVSRFEANLEKYVNEPVPQFGFSRFEAWWKNAYDKFKGLAKL